MAQLTGIFSFGNVTGVVSLVVLAAGIFWALTLAHRPVMTAAAMLRTQDRVRPQHD